MPERTESIASTDGELEPDDALALVQHTFDLAPYGAEFDLALHDAEQRMLRVCMAESGFTYTALPFVDTTIAVNRDARAWFPRLPSADAVLQQGYQAFWQDEQIDDSAWSRVDALNESQSLEVVGYSDRLASCSVEGQEFIDKSVDRTATVLYGATVAPFLSSLVAAVDTSEEVQSALAGWSECMTRSGYAFTMPDEAFSVSIDPNIGERARIDQAVADLDCRVSVKLNDVRLRAAGRQVQVFVDRHPHELEELERATTKESLQIADLAARSKG